MLRAQGMDERFHRAQSVMAEGDVEGLATLLAEDPELASARSRVSHPTLLQCLVLSMPPVDRLEDMIEMLAGHGAELTNPLIAASGINNERAVVRLLNLGAKIDGNGCWSPLEEALYFGHAAMVSLLLERGATVGNLRTASGVGDLERVARCFDEHGMLTAEAGEIAWPFDDKAIPANLRGDRRQVLANALVYAAAWGRLEVARFLMDQGAEVNLIPIGFDYAGTPLHYAAFQDRGAMADFLLQHGADPSVRDTKVDGMPEDWAEHFGHTELAARLRMARERTK